MLLKTLVNINGGQIITPSKEGGGGEEGRLVFDAETSNCGGSQGGVRCSVTGP